ncbi:MAG: SGNH/GDSL hydrolase family protein [Planctomycetes bacterium]|nr:SGNH/GDSL hydrolase family protein [Planctomycetota bacterium]
MEAIRQLLQRDAPVKWVFTGDSITHGALHTIGWRDYTELFSERIRWEMRRSRDIVIKTGISGWTIERIAADLDWNVLQFRPDCVSIMVGLNDCNQGVEGLDRFRQTYVQTIGRIRQEAGAAILLHTPNGTLPTGGERRVQFLAQYVEAVRQVAAETNAPLVDHFTEWVQVEPKGIMHHWLAHGCHPNEYGHRAMAHAIFRALGIWDPTGWTCQLTVPR